MTTRPNEQQEPSMEEILSSIRRIIADEASEEDGDQNASGSRAERPDEDADTARLAAEDDAQEDVLELTEIVREDGDVIDLDRTLAQANAIEQGPGEADLAEPLQAEPDSGEQDGEGAIDGPVPWRHDSSATAEALAAQPSGEDGAESPINLRDDEMEDHQTVMQKKSGIESLVSDRAAGAATGAFAKLSQAIQRTPPEVAIADDSGRSVEQFVEDMMRPMLREWLEEYLPPLVERIVQKEIQKIVRRAEDD